MVDSQKSYEQDDWKNALRSKLITALIGEPAEKTQVYAPIGYYYQCCAPASIYKYCPDTQLHWDTIKSNQLWYSAPCNFNDVFDSVISIDDKSLMNDVLKLVLGNRKIRPGSKMWKEIHVRMKQELRSLKDKLNELRNTTGISCFSECEDSLLMWAHYANNHQGFCMEYDLVDISKELKFTAVPVIYSDSRVCWNSLKLENIEKEAKSLFICSLTSKSLDWSYEKEWRIIREQEACGDGWNADQKGALLKMIRPSSIILGCAVPSDFMNQVQQYCKTTQINLYKMEMDPLQYKLNRKTVMEFKNDR